MARAWRPPRPVRRCAGCGRCERRAGASKGAEATQLDTTAAGQLFRDGIEQGRNDAFDFTLRKVGKVAAKLLNQFRANHVIPASAN